MSDTERVRAWRQRLKEEGRVAMTIWVKADTKARYEDFALTYHQSPSELAQQALDAWSPTRGSTTDAVADTPQLRVMIQEAMAAALPAMVQAEGQKKGSAISAEGLATAPQSRDIAASTPGTTDTVADTAQLRAMIQDELAATTTPQLHAFQEHVAALVPGLVQAVLQQSQAEGQKRQDGGHGDQTPGGQNVHPVASERIGTTATVADTVTETPAPTRQKARERKVEVRKATGRGNKKGSAEMAEPIEPAPHARARSAPAPLAWPTAHKLSPMQAAELRGKRAAGVPHTVLMQEYGLSRATLFRYLKEPTG